MLWREVGSHTISVQDKAKAELGGKSMLLEECAAWLATLSESVSVVASSSPLQSIPRFGLPRICGRGKVPWWNYYRACLRQAETDGGRDWNLIVSCDMPFLTREWLSYLVGRAIESSAQVVVPRSEFGLEPLCACWRTDAAAELESALERGVRKVTEGIALLRAEVLDARDWKRFDSAGRLFWNMNTAADYEEARRIVEAEQS